jgi:hypothetical protein
MLSLGSSMEMIIDSVDLNVDNNDESDSISINVDAEYAYMLDSDSNSDITDEETKEQPSTGNRSYNV